MGRIAQTKSGTARSFPLRQKDYCPFTVQQLSITHFLPQFTFIQGTTFNFLFTNEQCVVSSLDKVKKINGLFKVDSTLAVLTFIINVRFNCLDPSFEIANYAMYGKKEVCLHS